MIPLSAKAIVRDGRSVLFLSNPRDEWELPGGWPEAGESLEETIAREVREECGIVVSAIRYVASRSCEVVPGKRVLIVCFECRVDRHEIVLSDEHNQFGWIDLDGGKPANLPDFYWEFCRQAG
ncbi:NUDIX hydrolase [Burkholderia reimsis]|uniref:NUDIX hydrolase n=1 Tax=Burkholderia reimsis TaxID=2234132 RepID=A0A365QI88_9BURK|nr:NUDIX hydrolase [Burkholderia reimsis]RBB32070.1 NUDIX hydrolase [Burkholderia reimsis]